MKKIVFLFCVICAFMAIPVFAAEEMTKGPETSNCVISIQENVLVIGFDFFGMSGGINNVNVGVIVEDNDGVIVEQLVADIKDGPFSFVMFGEKNGFYLAKVPLRGRLQKGDIIRASVQVFDKQGQKAEIIYKSLPFVEKIPI